MPKFDKPEELERHLKKAMDALMAEVIVTTQAELGSSRVSPVDTGRFRSSWFASEGTPSDEVAPEGTDRPSYDAMNLRVDSDKTYHLVNNLPYAQSVAIEGHVVSKPVNWFHDFRTVRIRKIQEAASKVVREKFEL